MIRGILLAAVIATFAGGAAFAFRTVRRDRIAFAGGALVDRFLRFALVSDTPGGVSAFISKE